MLCAKCKKNQATKTYELIKNGKQERVYYCLECYHNDFVFVETETALSACPYCGTTATQFKRTSLVGCAQCYTALAHVVFPVVSKMQGGEKHRGKRAYETEEERYRTLVGEERAVAVEELLGEALAEELSSEETASDGEDGSDGVSVEEVFEEVASADGSAGDGEDENPVDEE